MEALQRQEEELKSKLEDAATIVERRKLRAELRELRSQITSFSLNQDENANIVETKNDINANSILPKKDVKVSQTSSKIIDNEAKPTSESTKTKTEYRVTDETEQLHVKTADERANRRARRQERMAKLAKEQTDDSNKNEKSEIVNDRQKREEESKKETTKPASNGLISDKYRRKNEEEETRTGKIESRPRSYLSERKAESEKEVESKVKEETNARPVSQKLNLNINVMKKDENANVIADKSPTRSFGSTTKTFALKGEDEKKEGEKHVTTKPNGYATKSFGSSIKSNSLKKDDESDKKQIVSRPGLKFEQTKEDTNTSFVNTPKTYTSRTERKEERTVAIGFGGKMEQVKQTIESKSDVQNKQQFTNTRTTVSRVSSALDKFSGNGNDKAKALSTIGKALGAGSARNKFLNAEKDSNNKPNEFGLNFTKPSGQPGYTVKKFTETKIQEKSTSSGKIEFGLSFQKKSVDVKTNLRETEQGSVFKKASPSLQRRHQTAPAAPGQSINFKLGGGGSKASSVSDRMKMFKESEEDEKARIEKQKQKENQQRARLASDPTPVKSPTSSTAPCVKKREVKKPIKRTMSISNIVLDWCKEMVKDYGIEIKNFSGSWSNGLAFAALIHRFNPDKFDFGELDADSREKNFRTAFDTALEVKNIPKLLDVEDMVRMSKPEPRSVQCYVQWIWSVYGPISGYGPSMEEIKQAQVA